MAYIVKKWLECPVFAVHASDAWAISVNQPLGLLINSELD